MLKKIVEWLLAPVGSKPSVVPQKRIEAVLDRALLRSPQARYWTG